VLCLRFLQAAMVYVNTLMVQDVLATPAWVGKLTDADKRGITPLFWSYVAPDGEIQLDLNRRLQLRTDQQWPRRPVTVSVPAATMNR
jgi:hypothetical protein